MWNTCIECGCRTQNTTCSGCLLRIAEIERGVKKRHTWSDEAQLEHEERIIDHKHRVKIDEANMVSRGLNPNKHTFAGVEVLPGNKGANDIMQVEMFRSIHKHNTPASLSYEEIMLRGPLQMSPEMQLVNAIEASSDDVFAESIKKRPKMIKKWKARKFRSKK